MGVLNITPDSFSDGGEYIALEAAVARARELVRQGASIIDVGGESTRPGADRISAEEEQRRVIPVIEALSADGFTVSIDTVRADTAKRAIAAGASIVNDVSGGTADPEMLRVVAETGAEYVIMHWRGIPDLGHARSTYSDVVEEVRSELAALAARAIDAGVAPEKIILDPGFGFDKTTEQGWQLLANLDRLASLGYPLLLGVSRKRMLGETLGEGATMGDRDIATSVVSALSASHGVWGVRVHNVHASAIAVAVSRAWNRAPQSKDAPKTLSAASSFPAASPSIRAVAPSVGEDRITLTGLEVFAHHGVFDFEREQGQLFIIDAEVLVDMQPAADGDALANTVHYGELAEAILEAVANDPVDLIETLAQRVADVALGFAGVNEARITVHKPDAPIDATFRDVSVSIVRKPGPRA